MNELALFAGAGGGLLGTRLLGWRCVCAVEIDSYCREILLRRQEEGHLGPFPVWDDARTFDGWPWRGEVDVITAGFPCQPWSIAGANKGEEDDRNLWPDTMRIIREVGPRFCLLENVSGLRSKPYFGKILRDLAEGGFHVRWDCIPASSVGARHQRDRLWILAYAGCFPARSVEKSWRYTSPFRSQEAKNAPGLRETMADTYSSGLERFRKRVVCTGQEESLSSGGSEDVVDATLFGREPRRASHATQEQGGWEPHRGGVEQAEMGHALRPSEDSLPEKGGSWHPAGEPSWWSSEPRLGRVAHGVANRVDRLKAIGNGQVPAVVVKAWETLTEGLP